MKKITALLVALAAAVCFMSTALTASAAGDSSTITAAPGYGDMNVLGEFVTAPSNKVISVDISWEKMTFKYNVPSKGNWNPAEHSYANAGTPGWEDTKKFVKIVNHSNAVIGAEFAFTGAQSTNITGTVYKKSTYGQQDIYSEFTGKQYITTAVGTQRDSAPSATVYLGISGDAITESKRLGTLTVTISEPYIASNDAELMDAITNGITDITLARSFDFSQTLTFTNVGTEANPVTISGFDYTYRRPSLSRYSVVLNNSHMVFSGLTFGYSTDGRYENNSVVLVNNSSVTFDNVQIGESPGYPTIYSLKASNSKINMKGTNVLVDFHDINETAHTAYLENCDVEFESNSHTWFFGLLKISGTTSLKFSDTITKFEAVDSKDRTNDVKGKTITVADINYYSEWLE